MVSQCGRIALLRLRRGPGAGAHGLYNTPHGRRHREFSQSTHAHSSIHREHTRRPWRKSMHVGTPIKVEGVERERVARVLGLHLSLPWMQRGWIFSRSTEKGSRGRTAPRGTRRSGCGRSPGRDNHPPVHRPSKRRVAGVGERGVEEGAEPVQIRIPAAQERQLGPAPTYCSERVDAKKNSCNFYFFLFLPISLFFVY